MSDELPPLGSELEAMFDAAKAELPSAAAKAKARAALGLPSAVVTPPAPAAPATAATSSAGALTVVKGLVVLGLVAGSYALGVRTGDTRAREAFAALPPKTVIVEVPVPAKPEPVVEVALVAADVPDAGAVKAPVAKRPVVEESDDLMAELALLDAARTTLAENDPTKALATLSKYDATFPRGTMRTDAQLLRLETLLKAGRRAEAETLGKKLSSATDSELVRERVRRLLDAK
ncbi:MAG: hypothetical protein Q8L14_30525 [Myxococcales bacterium]|nr:hypothetical protein [Myxococcales bacterium]